VWRDSRRKRRGRKRKRRRIKPNRIRREVTAAKASNGHQVLVT